MYDKVPANSHAKVTFQEVYKILLNLNVAPILTSFCFTTTKRPKLCINFEYVQIFDWVDDIFNFVKTFVSLKSKIQIHKKLPQNSQRQICHK